MSPQLPKLAFGCLALLAVATSASAQAAAARAVPMPVSPGAERRPTLAASCPAFNWAPLERADAYELVVFEWLPPGQLSEDPVMQTTVPGRSAGWTPAANACFAADSTYLWFLRELNAKKEPIGAWSPGLAFKVATAASTAAAAKDEPTRNGAIAGATPAGGPPEQANGNPPPSVQDQLAAINTKLEQLLNPSPMSLEACGELAIEAEIHTEFGGDLDGEFEGRVGAEAFGTGVIGKVKAKPSWGFGAQVKAGLTPKLAFCYDLSPVLPGASTLSRATSTKAAALAGLSATDTNALSDKLLALIATLNLNGDRLTQAMDLVPEIGGGADPWSSFRSDGPVAKLAQVMPLPGTLGDVLKDPGQIIENFRSQLALCANSNLPPAIAGLIDEFCSLANNEKFAKLLNRVDTTVANVRSTVDAVREKVEDIFGALPTGDDCKFFCG